MGWGSLAAIMLFAGLQLWPGGDAPLLQQLQDRAAWPALTMIFFTLLAAGLSTRHMLAAAKARRRVHDLEREHPESSPDFFSPP
jgi:hypothetical protein